MAKGPAYYAKRTSQATTSTSKRVIKKTAKSRNSLSARRKKIASFYRKEAKE